MVERLAAIGLLVPKASRTPSNAPSLLPALLPKLLCRLQTRSYTGDILPKLFLSLPSSLLNAFVNSLLSHLVLYIDDSPSLEPSLPDSRIKMAIQAFSKIVDAPRVGGEAWDAVIASITTHKVIPRPTDLGEHARNRLIMGWASGAGDKAISALADSLLDKWTDAKWIRFSSFASHFQVTHLVMLTIGQLRPDHPFLLTASTSGRFLMACQSYLAHPDGAVRRLGMLVAETLSALTMPDGPDAEEKDETEDLMRGLDLEEGATKAPKAPAARRLKFGAGMWDGEGEGREEARWLRACIGVQDDQAALPPGDSPAWLLGWGTVPTEGKPSTAQPSRRGRSPSPKPYRPAQKPVGAASAKTKPRPKVVMLDEDDDPLSGYSSPSAASSRSPSPTPSYLEEVANDPTLALEPTDKKKVQRPVYVPQLLALLRDKDNPNAIEMALNHGEALVRAKRSFGTEVSESAANLVAQLVGMNDTYGLDDFDKKRGALTRAVVACAPKQTAPYVLATFPASYEHAADV